MHPLTKRFVEYCEVHFNLYDSENYDYRSLPVCIIDCVYSLYSNYDHVTVPIVNRYVQHCMNGNITSSDDTISRFLECIETAGGPARFADAVLKNHQKLGGRYKIPKEDVCYQLARYLKYLHIETLADFQNFECQELLETVIRSVKGMGDAGANYLFMLAGDSGRCKPDRHLHQCIHDSCGCTIDNEECQILLTDSVRYLNTKYPELTVRRLDGIIWKKHQSRA